MRGTLAAWVVAILAVGCSGVPFPTVEECPGALLSGPLVRSGDDLVVATEFGAQPVLWPDGYVVVPGRELALLDDGRKLVASEGDIIFIGGGMDGADETFIACGYVSTEPP